MGPGFNDVGGLNGLMGRFRIWKVWVLMGEREKLTAVAVASMVMGIERGWK